MAQARRRAASGRRTPAARVLDGSESSLLDVVDNVLSKGVVLSGDVTLALAQVDLVYLRLSVLLCAVDRILPHEDEEAVVRHHGRRLRRNASRRARP